MSVCRLCEFPVEGARIYHQHCRPSIEFLHTKNANQLAALKGTYGRILPRRRFTLLRANESGRVRLYLHIRLGRFRVVISRHGVSVT